MPYNRFCKQSHAKHADLDDVVGSDEYVVLAFIIDVDVMFDDDEEPFK